MKRFIECLIPVTVCNLKCDYCYVIQHNDRTMQMPKLQLSPKAIGNALNINRLGGVCLISICGAGETLIPRETTEIVRNILIQGHYVNVTTNGTLTSRFKEMVSWDSELRKRLHIAFSLHYIELKRLNLLERFFQNVRMMREAGCSVLVQFNLYDGYVPLLNEIKEICLKEIGALPQVAVTRKESNGSIYFHTEGSDEAYIKYGREFNSPLWEFTLKNFMYPRREFCYAGDWSTTLNLATGEMTGCYGMGIKQNIFDNIDKPIRFRAIGKCCRSIYCINSSHFLSLGSIPSLETPTYAQLRNRSEAGWYSEELLQFLSGKLTDENHTYTAFQKSCATIVAMPQSMASIIKRKIMKIVTNE